MHALAGALDDIVDYAEETGDRLGLYGVEAPMEQAQQIAEVLVGAAEHVAAALRGLRNGHDMSAAPGRDPPARERGRPAAARGRRLLFATGIDPMIVIRWKDIFDSLEAAVDACETVANVLEGIGLRRAR